MKDDAIRRRPAELRDLYGARVLVATALR
jgi:hypothetical protein